MKCINADDSKTPKKISYPCIMHNGKGYIVIMHSKDGECTVLKPSAAAAAVRCGDFWSVVHSQFTLYDGPVTIQN